MEVKLKGKSAQDINRLVRSIIDNNVKSSNKFHKRISNVVSSAFARAYSNSLPIKNSMWKNHGVYTGKLKLELLKKTRYKVKISPYLANRTIYLKNTIDILLPAVGRRFGKNSPLPPKKETVKKLTEWFRVKIGVSNPVAAASATYNKWKSLGHQPASAKFWYDPKLNRQLSNNIKIEIGRSSKASMSHNKK